MIQKQGEDVLHHSILIATEIFSGKALVSGGSLLHCHIWDIHLCGFTSLNVSSRLLRSCYLSWMLSHRVWPLFFLSSIFLRGNLPLSSLYTLKVSVHYHFNESRNFAIE